ncbi:MAG: dehydrogenase [Planctomycetaceae bacterium]|nr:dehydrogenase [Planctomycetaceae bacterium]
MTQINTNQQTDLDPFDTDQLLRFYEQMMLIRRFELRVQVLYRAGKIPGFIHLYVGEEATATGICAHLTQQDKITSTHRGHGHALAKGCDPNKVLAELAAKSAGTNGGRGGSMHLYDPDTGLLGTNGFVGGGIPSAVGAAISAKVRQTDHISVAFFGDGAINHAAIHESMNLAGALNAPIVFVCENNLYATATPLAQATRNTDIASRAAAYGVPGIAVDGNDVIAVHNVMAKAAHLARSGEGPTLIESRTYRTVGHHEGDQLVGTYRTQEELDEWQLRCPIHRFRTMLIDAGRATDDQFSDIDTRIEQRVDAAEQFAMDAPHPEPASAHQHIWADPINPPMPDAPPAGEPVEQGYLDAVRDGIADEMRRDPHIIYLGEGIGERAGSFAHTKGLWDEFGNDRVIDTAICELAFTGAAAGASATGCRAVADLMFADFLFEAASQVIEQAAKLRYMSNGQISVPMVIRAPIGPIKNAGPHHSGNYYPIWAHCPGLIVVVPSNAADAKGLFRTALRASDPVVFMEPKSLFPTKHPVPPGEWLVPFGSAAVVRAGTDLTIVTCGTLVGRSLEAAQQLQADGISCEVIDLRTIVPLDIDTIVASVAKTHHVLVADEAFAMCGLGAEIAAVMMEHAFDLLDAPVGRLHTDPAAHPFSPPLENEVIVSVQKIIAAAGVVLKGRPLRPRRARTGATTAHAAPPMSTQSAPKSIPSAAAPPAVGPPDTPDIEVDGIPITMPNLDLTITEATVVRWIVEIGQSVEQGQPIVEVETDKAVTELEAPADGTLSQIIAPEDTVVELGELIGIMQPA